MDIIFIKAGKYKNDVKTLEIKEIDIENKRPFSVVELNAISYIKAGCAKLAKEIKADRKSPEKFEDDKPKKSDKKAEKK